MSLGSSVFIIIIIIITLGFLFVCLVLELFVVMLCVFQDAVSSCSCFMCTVILDLWCHLCLCAHFESFCRVFCVFIWSQTASSYNHNMNMNDWKRYEIMFVFCSRFACLNFFSSVVFSLCLFLQFLTLFFVVAHILLSWFCVF